MGRVLQLLALTVHGLLLHYAQPHGTLEVSGDAYGVFTSPVQISEEGYREQDKTSQTPATQLIIGIKTSVLRNARLRDAIRETWADQANARALGVRIVFLGCEPDYSALRDASASRQQVDDEKRARGDLLTFELGCRDAYESLVDKTVGFTKWVAQEVLPRSPTLRYVMVVDDDVYLRVEELLDWLHRAETPRHRFYAGRVYSHLKPVRDPTDKNYLALSDYPMSELPPFATGPLYLLSTDLVQFLARNSNDLRGVGVLEDVSVGMWLLALQVHPQHIPEFELRRSNPCREDLIAFADLSSKMIKQMHRNLETGGSLCDYLQTLEQEQASYTWTVSFSDVLYDVQVDITLRVGNESTVVRYIPASMSHQDGFCTIAEAFLAVNDVQPVYNDFCPQHQHQLHAHLVSPHMRAQLTLPRHNLLHDLLDRVITVALSGSAKYARAIFENLLVELHRDARIYVSALRDLASDQYPDYVVMSILDDPEPKNRDSTGLASTLIVERFKGRSTVVMVSGEAWPIQGLDPSVILVSTVAATHQPHPKHIYLPVASAAFAETIQHSPMELLQPHNHTISTPHQDRKFAAYLYARCDRPLREYMYDLLNEREPVDALGACQGTKQPPKTERLDARYRAPFYMDEAVQLYTQYKFVIAFENTYDAPGYVTEKIVTAFLAGSVPIYYGHSATVTRLFNPRAFINCGDVGSLRECVDRVMEVHASVDLYEAMVRERPVVDEGAFVEAFSWHPDVVDYMKTLSSSLHTELLSEKLSRSLGRSSN